MCRRARAIFCAGVAKSSVMAKSQERGDQGQEIELRPDGWERFEKAVDAAVRTEIRIVHDAEVAAMRAVHNDNTACLKVLAGMDEISHGRPSSQGGSHDPE